MLLTPRLIQLAEIPDHGVVRRGVNSPYIRWTPTLRERVAAERNALDMLLVHQQGAVKVGEVVRYDQAAALYHALRADDLVTGTRSLTPPPTTAFFRRRKHSTSRSKTMPPYRYEPHTCTARTTSMSQLILQPLTQTTRTMINSVLDSRNSSHI